ERLEQRMREISHSRNLREIHTGVSTTVHHAALVLLSTGELAFNLVAFKTLREADLFTFVMSLSVGVAFPVAAYFGGLVARRWQSRTTHVTALLGTTAVVLLFALWGVNEIRVAHLRAVDPGFLQRNPALNLAFIPVNLLVVLAASLLAFLRHDSV